MLPADCFFLGTADDDFGLLESVQKTITAESIGIDNFCTITIFAFYAPLALGMCYARSGCKPGSMSHDLDISNIVWPNFCVVFTPDSPAVTLVKLTARVFDLTTRRRGV